MAPEHRRGHGALYDGLNQGRIEIGRLRRTLAGLALPRARVVMLEPEAAPTPVPKGRTAGSPRVYPTPC